MNDSNPLKKIFTPLVLFGCLLSVVAHGADPVKAPLLQTSPVPELPTAEKLAEEMGYKQTEFKKYVELFASALSQGKRGDALKKLCARDEDTCDLISDFHNQEWQAKTARKRSRSKIKHFRITDKNIAQAQRFDFPILINSLKVEDEYRLFDLAEKSLKEPECPRNLSAALSIKAEEYFPNQKAKVLAKELFEHARHCLQPDNQAYERLFLRQGLIAYYDGESQKAREYWVVAKQAKTNTERYRVLYWLGRMAHDSGVKPGDNQDWTELMNQFPLSFYAIVAASTIKKDPVEMITQMKLGGMKREVADDFELNHMIRWLEALYVFKKPAAVAKWASWIVRANESDLDVDVLHYLSTIKIAAGMYRSNINMLFGYFKKNPSALNEEGLRLLYPRPYYDIIDDASHGKIDTYLVLGLVRQESAFDSRAVSRARAKGLMQIIPGTARRLASQGHKKLMNEKENTKMGVKYLVQLSERFTGRAELVLAAYNAGPNKVDEWLKRNPEYNKDPLLWNDLIPYMETRDYVVSILRNNYLYARLYGQQEVGADKIFSSALVHQLLTAK